MTCVNRFDSIYGCKDINFFRIIYHKTNIFRLIALKFYHIPFF